MVLGPSVAGGLAEVLFAYQSLSAVEALTAAQLADWQAEARQWAETGLEVPQE